MALLFEDKVYLKYDLLKKILKKISLAKYAKKNPINIQLLHTYKYIHTYINT